MTIPEALHGGAGLGEPLSDADGETSPAEAPRSVALTGFCSEELEECFEGDGRAIAEVVERYISDFGRYLDRFEAALRAQDGELLADAAHAARGACLLIGLPVLADLCLRLERAGGRCDFGAARGDLAAARDCWAEQASMLVAYIEVLRRRG